MATVTINGSQDLPKVMEHWTSDPETLGCIGYAFYYLDLIIFCRGQTGEFPPLSTVLGGLPEQETTEIHRHIAMFVLQWLKGCHQFGVLDGAVTKLEEQYRPLHGQAQLGLPALLDIHDKSQEYKGIVRSEFDAMRLLSQHHKSINPKDSAMSGFPESDEEQVAFVKTLYEAMVNMDDVVDNVKTPARGDKRKNAENEEGENPQWAVATHIKRIQNLNSIQLELLAWKVFIATRDAQQGNLKVCEWAPDFAYRSYPTFLDRWAHVVNLFRTSKAAVHNLLTADLTVRLAAMPDKELRRKKSNKGVNDKRGIQVKAGIQALSRSQSAAAGPSSTDANTENPALSTSTQTKRKRVTFALDSDDLDGSMPPAKLASYNSEPSLGFDAGQSSTTHTSSAVGQENIFNNSPASTGVPPSNLPVNLNIGTGLAMSYHGQGPNVSPNPAIFTPLSLTQGQFSHTSGDFPNFTGENQLLNHFVDPRNLNMSSVIASNTPAGSSATPVGMPSPLTPSFAPSGSFETMGSIPVDPLLQDSLVQPSTNTDPSNLTLPATSQGNLDNFMGFDFNTSFAQDVDFESLLQGDEQANPFPQPTYPSPPVAAGAQNTANPLYPSAPDPQAQTDGSPDAAETGDYGYLVSLD